MKNMVCTGPSELAPIHPAEDLDKGDTMGMAHLFRLVSFAGLYDPQEALKCTGVEAGESPQTQVRR